jgi:inner membrane protein
MDLITQAILGAAVGQAAGIKKLGRKSIVAGAIGGIIPDLDVFFNFFFVNGEMLYHRGFTHSLWFGPLLGLVLGYFLQRRYQGSLLSWVMVMIGSLLTHPLLDLFTVYGTQLFAPFSNRRFSIPAVPIIDPFYSLPLLIAPLYSLFYPLKRAHGQLLAMILLTTTTAYISWGYRQNCLAETYAREMLLNNGVTVTRIHAFPTLLQIYLRRIIVYCQTRSGEEEIKVGYLSTWHINDHPKIFWETKRIYHSPLLEIVKNHPMAQLFTWFAEEKVFIEKLSNSNLESSDLEETFAIRDLRYGVPGTPPWGIWAMVFQSSPTGWKTSVQRFPFSFNWSMVKTIYTAAFALPPNNDK